MKYTILALICFMALACAKTTQIAVDAEQNLHNSLRSFRTELNDKCDGSDPILTEPCDTVREGWVKLLDTAILYDQTLLAGKVNEATVNEFRSAIGEFISLVKSVKMDDLLPDLIRAQASLQ